MSFGIGLVMLQLKRDQVLVAQCQKAYFSFMVVKGPLWIVLPQGTQAGGMATTPNLANNTLEGKGRPGTGLDYCDLHHFHSQMITQNQLSGPNLL